MSGVDGPYRAPPAASFVCLACETRDAQAGLCPACGVERLPLSDAEVRRELAAADERRLHARAGREQALLGAAAFLAAAPLRWLGGWLPGTLLWLGVGLFATTLAWRLVARFGRRTALHVFRARAAELERLAPP
jgi:hypothetical protein